MIPYIKSFISNWNTGKGKTFLKILTPIAYSHSTWEIILVYCSVTVSLKHKWYHRVKTGFTKIKDVIITTTAFYLQTLLLICHTWFVSPPFCFQFSHSGSSNLSKYANISLGNQFIFGLMPWNTDNMLKYLYKSC